MSLAAHAHTFRPGPDATRTPVVVLHGSGGTEFDLIPLAQDLVPGAAVLGVRGMVAVDGGYSFFRRFPNRQVDQEDIAARAPILAMFIHNICRADDLVERPPLLVGFSNGAIMASALLMSNPGLFAGAILFRPLRPFTHDPDVRLDGKPVLVTSGRDDTRRAPDDGPQAAAQLRRLGAAVTDHVLPVGHAITDADRHIAREWIAEVGL